MTGKNMKQALMGLLACVAFAAAAQTDEEKVGKAAAAQVLGAAPLVPADHAQQYVNVLGQALSAQSGAIYK